MRFEVLTIFPNIIKAYLSEGILKRAIERGVFEVDIINIRDFTTDKHRQVDDYPYGGGAGMVMKPEPIFRAMDHLKRDGKKRYVLLLSPSGRVFNQALAEEYAERFECLTLISGRYEGVDERVKTIVDDEVSIGDYVLTGGELPALVIIDAVARLLPGTVGDMMSVSEESFTSGILEYPQYTRPAEFRGLKVPEVLLSGNHEEIRRWRRKEALRKTLNRRPDLLEKIKLSDEDLRLIQEIREEENGPDQSSRRDISEGDT
jgi:tRNA (guanine37-N1)-methyltransferase